MSAVKPMFYYTSTTSRYPYSRDAWLQIVGSGNFKFQPPDWWFRSQKEQGRTTHAAAAIWHKNYPPARQRLIWEMASDEDFIARGYLR